MSFTFGEKFRVTIFGESHAPCIGAIVEGVPAGTKLDLAAIQTEMDKRRGGQSALTTSRKEPDLVCVKSGVEDGKATGGPVRIEIGNTDAKPSSYGPLRDTPRPGHADFTARMKYGESYCATGGGFFSGRMTAAMVAAGAIARQVLAGKGVTIHAHVVQIGSVSIGAPLSDKDIEKNVFLNDARCADVETGKNMAREVLAAKEAGDSVGAVVECRIRGVPAGAGEPMFGSLESVLAHALFAIPGVKGVEFGSGFAGSRLLGSQNNDPFILRNGKVVTATNNAGGILGGIATGMPVVFRVAFKPTPSIALPQKTVNLKTMQECEIRIEGRHDPCIAIRGVPVVEAVAAFALLDAMMR